MTSIVAVGDNVVDCYPALERMFPGGNCINVAVFARRLGARTAYVGAVGPDAAGAAIHGALSAERVGTERLRILPGKTAHCVIGHEDGDRVFLSADFGVSMFEPDAGDLAYVAAFDAVHVGQSSGLDDAVVGLAERARLSYDFSSKLAHPRFDEITARCFLASFSGGSLSEPDTLDLLSHAGSRGARWTLVTRGERGALLGGLGRVFAVAAHPFAVVDTLGAGDTFIAGTLVGLLQDAAPPEVFLAAAAKAAAETCGHFGAIGHGAPLELQPTPA
jgi:fructoselysine 6-kinase